MLEDVAVGPVNCLRFVLVSRHAVPPSRQHVNHSVSVVGMPTTVAGEPRITSTSYSGERRPIASAHHTLYTQGARRRPDTADLAQPDGRESPSVVESDATMSSDAEVCGGGRSGCFCPVASSVLCQ